MLHEVTLKAMQVIADVLAKTWCSALASTSLAGLFDAVKPSPWA